MVYRSVFDGTTHRIPRLVAEMVPFPYAFPCPPQFAENGSVPFAPSANFCRVAVAAINCQTIAEAARRAPIVRLVMCYLCDGMAPTCGWAAAASKEDHFLTLPKRSRKRFTPPNFEDFLWELFNGLQKGTNSPPPRAASKRARDRAEPTKDAPETGMSDRPAPGGPARVQCSAGSH